MTESTIRKAIDSDYVGLAFFFSLDSSISVGRCLFWMLMQHSNKQWQWLHHMMRHFSQDYSSCRPVNLSQCKCIQKPQIDPSTKHHTYIKWLYPEIKIKNALIKKNDIHAIPSWVFFFLLLLNKWKMRRIELRDKWWKRFIWLRSVIWSFVICNHRCRYGFCCAP